MAGDIVSHRNRAIDWRTSCPAIGKEQTRPLKLHLALTLHVAEKLDSRYLSAFSLETQQGDHHTGQQRKADQENPNHSRKAP
jgi:hypothetical protein